MTQPRDIALRAKRRIEALQAAGHPITQKSVSLAVTGKDNLFTAMTRASARMPGTDRIAKLAETLFTSADFLVGRSDEPGVVPSITGEGAPSYRAPKAPTPTAPDDPGEWQRWKRDLPVYGSKPAGHLETDETVPLAVVDMSAPADKVPRPPSLANRSGVYMTHVVGDSMAPKFEPSEPIFVDRTRPPAPGDAVVVHLKDGTGKTLFAQMLGRTRQGLLLKQFKPDHEFEIPDDGVEVHTVMRWWSFMQ